MTGGRGVTMRHLSAVAGVLTVLSLLVWVLHRRTGGLVPAPPLISVALLLVMAALVVAVAWPVRTYLRGIGRRVDPLRAARALTVAQAGALTGSGAFGWYLGQLLVALADIDLTVQRSAAGRLALTMVAAAVLAGCGLWAQRMCRVDEPPDDQRPGRGTDTHA